MSETKVGTVTVFTAGGVMLGNCEYYVGRNEGRCGQVAYHFVAYPTHPKGQGAHLFCPEHARMVVLAELSLEPSER